MAEKVDVLICGSGSAGVCAATWLARCGLSCKIVDSRLGPLLNGQADGVQCRTVEIFESFGLAEELLRESYHVLEVCFWSANSQDELIRTNRIADTPAGLSHQPHLIINQARVHGILIDAMRSFNGQEVEYGYTVKSVQVDSATAKDPEAHCVTVIATKDGRDEKIDAKYVLGCDGAHSTVRRSLGYTMIGDSTNDVWGVMDIFPRTDFPDIRKKAVIQSPHGSLLIIPREGGSMVRFYIQLGRGVIAKEVKLDDLHSAAARILSPFKLDIASTFWWSAYSIGQRLADHFSKDNRVFLTGDACHTHSPKAGQGMNVSLQDGYNIGWKLASILKGQASPDLLYTYNIERKKVAATLIDFDRAFTKSFSSKNTDAESFIERFIRAGRYTAGLTAKYDESSITNVSGSTQHLAAELTVGMRFPSTPVVRLCDARVMQLVTAMPSDGRWRIVLFAGDIRDAAKAEKLKKLGEFLFSETGPVQTYTPPTADIDSFIEVLVVLSGVRHDIDAGQIPSVFSPIIGKWRISDIHKIFVDEEIKDEGCGTAYDFYGVDSNKGAAVIVRPDQYVSMVTAIEDHDGLRGFFSGWGRVQRYIQHLRNRIHELENDQPEGRTGLSGLTEVNRDDNNPFPTPETLREVNAIPLVLSSSHGQPEPLRSAFEYAFTGEHLLAARNQPSHNSQPEVLFGLEVPQSSRDSSSDREKHQNRDDAVSAMGAASHISDRVTTAQEHFYGNSSAVSFQHQVQETLRRSTGEPDLVRSQPSIMKRLKQPSNALSPFLDQCSRSKLEALALPPRALADHLLDLYWNRVHCLYPFVHKPSFLRSYEQLWARESAAERDDYCSRQAIGLGGSNFGLDTFSCALNAMFALGCQFSDLAPEEREALTDTFFRRGKHYLHIDILDDGDLALVQSLLIMAQFLQSTHYPDRCWNMVGLACRVAQGIGLYLDESNENRSALEIEMRRRAWYGCVLLDTVVSMTLGRPTITSGQSDVPLPMVVNDDSLDVASTAFLSPNSVNPPLLEFFVQAVKLNKILAEILTDVYKPWSRLGRRNKIGQQLRNNSFDTIIRLDYTLSDFESNVPSQLHWTRRDPTLDRTEIVDRQVNVLHARFTHLKMHLYRPIFNQLCIESKMGCSKGPSGDSERQDMSNNMLYSHLAPHCAVACVGAAEELIDIIDHASQTTATGAWWYNLFSMVLVLAELCPTVLEPEKSGSVRQSWDQCQRVLERMSRHNDAAKQCAKTLSSMHQQVFSKSNTQAARNPITHISGTTTSTYPTAIETGVQIPQQIGLYEAADAQPPVSNDYMLTDVQIQDMISQNMALQPPWNLDDTGWGDLLSQNHS
ncbi:hypothetical protein VE01_04449 [Pseudogymnoascus verrucosus]|uniref:Xylanolytic transcriptional activator regulatory domain-containing protein n=1 Tax=Pseudogymnoascus verrucosus TaxID=342668 RepID=A0A1B8GP62_9PEZI|nr:uncharacterized protein VE01_04449 [Pseudogymnoascus verrucosus]OBT97633.1 hypothetical protein VE01_04449 [Pseudogymnoascus verrucosus]